MAAPPPPRKIEPPILPVKPPAVPVPVSVPVKGLVPSPQAMPPPPAPQPPPVAPKWTGGAIQVPPGTKLLQASSYCRGLKGADLEQCYEDVADWNSFQGTGLKHEKILAREEAGRGSAELTPREISKITGGGEQRVVEVRTDTNEGKTWAAFLRWTDTEFQVHGKPIGDQIIAVRAAIKKLDDENSIENRIGNFFSNPLALITSAIAAYATMGASLGATVGGLIKGDDSIDAAIGKLRKLQDELQKRIDRIPTRAAMELIAPPRATRIKVPSSPGVPSRYIDGTDAYPNYFFVFVEDVL